MLYQLSYEATHWDRGQFIELMSAREEWNNVKYISQYRGGHKWPWCELPAVFSSFVWLEGNLARNILSGFDSATPLLYLCHILHGTHTRKIQYKFLFSYLHFRSYRYCALWELKASVQTQGFLYLSFLITVIKGHGCIQKQRTTVLTEKILSVKGNTIRLC